MAVTVTNPQDIFMPVVEEIAAQTASIEALAACQAQAQVNIAQSILCASPSAADVNGPPEVPCCRTETLENTPEFNDTTERTTCTDGSIVDVITYADGQVCTVNVAGVNPVSEIVGYDENGNLCTTDVPNACDPSIPVDYFIPLASDFGNQIWCIPGNDFAFAWSGVTSKNLKTFLSENAGVINLDDPANQYVAVVNGGPYTCSTDPLHPLQETQVLKFDGCYAEMGTLCEKPEVVDPPEPPAGGNPLDFIVDLLPTVDDCTADDLIAGKSAQDAYYTLWADWWCCEKRSKQIQQYIYWGQLPVALYGLITSINTYNDILDKNLDMICASQEDLDLVARCSAEILGTADEPGLLKICQSNLLEGHNDRIGLINNRGQFACDLAESELDCYDKLWKPLQTEHAPHMASQLHTMLANGKDSSELAQSWAEGLQECITENMLPEIKRQFGPLMASMGCTSTNLNDWRQELKDKAAYLSNRYKDKHACPEDNMIVALMDATTCMVERTCELRDWLYDCAREDQDIYRKGYQQGEVPQAQAAMSTSAQLIPKIVESVCWLDTNIPHALDIFKTCYGEPQEKLNPRLYAEASDLAPEIRRCYAFFRDNALDYKKFFEECYKESECRLVKQQLDFACNLALRHKDSLERIDEWSVTDREMFTKHFKSQEIQSLVTSTEHGIKAGNELHLFSEWFNDRTKEFHDTYHAKWLPCDIENLEQHCQIWTRGNPLQGIERNNEEMQVLSNELQEFHSDGLVQAKTYLDQVFKQHDQFDYCIEGPAVAHVRAQVDQALDELEKCTPKYARGHLLAAKQQLKIGGARAIGAASETAMRWKWWANEQMDQRNFDRRVALMSVLDSAAIRAIEASKTETAGYDLLLTHSRDAIVRGQIYLNHMQQSGQTTSSIDTNQVDAMLRSVQLMHFWPELALRENGEFNAQNNQLMDDAQQLIQFGHGWRDAASREKTSATQVMGQSFDVALRLSQMGQYYLSQADSMNAQRAGISANAGQLGAQYAGLGHNLHKVAADKVGNALQQTVNSAQMGLGASDAAYKQNALAIDTENKMTLNALEHLKAGISAFAIGIDFLQEVRQSYELSGSYGINASNGLLNMMKHGQNSGLMGLTANEQCYDMNYQMLCKAKDFLQKNHQLNMQALHGDNTVASTNNLLAQQGDSVSSAFGLLGNSLQGITQNSGSPPFPSGAGAFGLNGSTF